MWWLAGLLGIALIGWGIVLSARVVLYPERRRLAPPDPLPAYSVTTLRDADGAAFDVWRLEGVSSRARLLLFHGFYANRYQVLDIAQGLRERGYDILLFELRGHGARAGPCTLGLKEAEDARTVLEWASHQPGAKPLPIGLLGFSLGAAVACQVAMREPSVRALVVDSIYSHFFPILRRSLWRQFRIPAIPVAWFIWWSAQLALRHRLDPLDPAALAPRLDMPLLAIQGGEDRRVVPMLGREFFQRWAGPKERWFDRKVVHVGMFAKHPREYCDRVANFLDRAFA